MSTSYFKKGIILTLLLFGFCGMFSQSSPIRVASPSPSYLDVSPIFIDDSDPTHNWATFASNNPWCFGSGAPGDPYTILDVRIDGMQGPYCIMVQNSNKFFQIADCRLFDTSQNEFGSGIIFENVSNGFIFNSIIYSNGFCGICIVTSSILVLAHNTIHNSKEYGISLVECSQSLIQMNNIHQSSGAGIELLECSEIAVYDNDLSYNGFYGIVCDYTNNSEIKENTINHNDEGIFLAASSNCLIETNTVSDNNECGIMLGFSSNFNTITNNVFFNNLYCISIGTSCQGTQISNNGECQVYSFDDIPEPHDDDDNNNSDTPPSIPGYPSFILITIFGIAGVVLSLLKKENYESNI